MWVSTSILNNQAVVLRLKIPFLTLQTSTIVLKMISAADQWKLEIIDEEAASDGVSDTPASQACFLGKGIGGLMLDLIFSYH